MVRIDNENTFKKAIFEEINLFLGAGFSILAKNEQGLTLPLGSTFKEELIARFNIGSGTSSLELPQLCSVIDRSNRAELQDFYRERFLISIDFDARYEILNTMKVKNIFTTNVDNLIHKIYSSSSTYYINDLMLRGAVQTGRNAISLIHLHGSILDENNPPLFNPLELSSAFRSDPDKWHYLTSQIQQTSTLFWGYRLADAGVLDAINPRTIRGRSQKPKWIILHKENSDARQYFEALGFYIIIATTSEMLDYLAEKTNESAGQYDLNLQVFDLATHFPNESVPRLDSVSARPIEEFYQGAVPAWLDIFQDRIYRTSHYSIVDEEINSGKNVIVLGLPASGKTTLMMQLASSQTRPKLICKSLSREYAEFITKTVGDSIQNVVIFVDDFSDDIEAFLHLLEHPNFQVIGFEREYNYNLIVHKVDASKVSIKNITSLKDVDIQEILERVPLQIRKSRNEKKPKMLREDINPSMFEIIQYNLKLPSLKDRFTGLIKELEKRDVYLSELLIMICYVHYCKTTVSFDMAIAFLRGCVDDYAEVSNMIDALGEMVNECQLSAIMPSDGKLRSDDVDSEQSHFQPRSTIVSEQLFNSVPQAMLKRVLMRFHTNISSWRISRFDIFRRKGYDADLMKRAFFDWKEGQDFYDVLYERDQSYSLLQQCALYLAHKKVFGEAFSYIDEAISQSAGRNFAVKNSHAIIWFKANIGKDRNDQSVRDNLDKSMDLLADCYSKDRRKLYHAKVFAEQSLIYFESYDDNKGCEYLHKAEDWLKEEKRKLRYDDWNLNNLITQLGKSLQNH